MWYHLDINKKVFLCIVCISVLTTLDLRLIYGQERFLLTEAELPGFELSSQMNRSWEIADKALNKIEANLSQDILDTETVARQKQVPETDYQTITNRVVNSTLNGFSFHTTWDSKWLPGLRAGRTWVLPCLRV